MLTDQPSQRRQALHRKRVPEGLEIPKAVAVAVADTCLATGYLEVAVVLEAVDQDQAPMEQEPEVEGDLRHTLIYRPSHGCSNLENLNMAVLVDVEHGQLPAAQVLASSSSPGKEVLL